jgi:phosphatidylinositol-bisphosphatase
VAAPQLIGLLLLVFVSPELKPMVGSVATTTVGTGLMGYGGNKGAVGVRIVLGDTLRLTIVDCHLAAFATAVDRRNWDSAEILRRMAFDPVAKEVVGLREETPGEGMEKQDVVLWCGDLNYRIDLDNADVRALLAPWMPKDLPPTHADVGSPVMSPVRGSFEWPSSARLPPTPTEAHPSATGSLQGTIDSLLKHDQLLKQRREEKALPGFKEGRVTFLPTYKYDVGTVGVWDSSEKGRTPGWCDRILWRVKDSDSINTAQETNGRNRSYSVASSILKDEILFESADDSDDEDLVVSRAESPVPKREKKRQEEKEPALVWDAHTSSVQTPCGEIRLEMQDYMSHQDVSSSDHKPVSAMFTLTFPVVEPELRAKVHAEVAREVDKLENERRPVVTVIIDQPIGSGDNNEVLHFGEVRYWERKHREVMVANTGASAAKLHFVSRPSLDDGAQEVICKSWLSVEFLGYTTKEAIKLEPGDVATISITLRIDQMKQVLDLNDQREVLDDVLILRVDGGRDVFIPVSAEWLCCSYGTTLKELVKIPENIGGFRGYYAHKAELAEGPLYSAPREIYRLTQFLCDAAADVVSTLGPDEKIEDKRWFSHLGWPLLRETWMYVDDEERRSAVEVGVWEALDTDQEFEDCVRVALREDEEGVAREEHLEAAAAVFLRWFDGLQDGVIPASFWDEVVKAGGDVKAAEQVPSIFSLLPGSMLIVVIGPGPSPGESWPGARKCLRVPGRLCGRVAGDLDQEEGRGSQEGDGEDFGQSAGSAGEGAG